MALTNFEVKVMFCHLISRWFGRARDQYNRFIRALIAGNSEDAEDCLEDVLMNTAS